MTEIAFKRAFWSYAALSAGFWLVVWQAGWEFASGSSTTHIAWEAAVVNLVLLVPLWRRVVWVWHVLAIEALLVAVAFAWSFGEVYSLLALPAVAQHLLLWRMRTPRELVEPRSTY